jgi:hypothetical protein
MTRLLKDVYYDSGVEGWIKTYSWSNRWRLQNWYDMEELIQDGYLCYLKCRNMYTLGPPKPGHQDLNTDAPNKEQRKHFMALLQRTFSNHVTTIAARYARDKENTLSELATGENAFELEAVLPPQPEETSALIAVLHAPTEIGEAIVKLVQDGVDGGRYLRSKLRDRQGRVVRVRRALRETTNQRLARVCGGDAEMPKLVRDYLTLT